MKSLLFISMMVVLFMGCFQEKGKRERIERLGSQIRCPVCRGVSIGDSPSELAREMMQLVKEQVEAGKSDREILKFFEERYGEWALLTPKAEGMNLAIWILPGLFVVGGAGGILSKLKKKKVSLKR